jgi:hypothetical protein
MSLRLRIIVGLVLGLSIYLIASQFMKNSRGKKVLQDEAIDMSKPWALNTLHNFSFETPEPAKKENVTKPAVLGAQIKEFDVYFYKKNHFVTMFLFMDTDFITYDTRTGLQGTIQNSVNVVGGRDLKLDFTKPEGNLSDLLATGTYTLKNEEVMVRGYAYWNEKGKVFILMSMIRKGDGNDKIIQKVIDSRKIIF